MIPSQKRRGQNEPIRHGNRRKPLPHSPGCCRSALSPTAPKNLGVFQSLLLPPFPPKTTRDKRNAPMVVCVHALRVYSSRCTQHATYQQHRHRGPGGVSREHQVAASAEVSQQRAHPGRHVVPSLRLVVIIQGLAVRSRSGKRCQGHAQTPHQVRHGPDAKYKKQIKEKK